jgi:CHAT domain/AAA domain
VVTYSKSLQYFEVSFRQAWIPSMDTIIRTALVADLRILFFNLSLEGSDASPRAKADFVLEYDPADGGSRLATMPSEFVIPDGPIDATDLAWYLERYVDSPWGAFRDRARDVEQTLPIYGQLLYRALIDKADQGPLVTWRNTAAARRLTVQVSVSPLPGAAARQANRAAALVLSLPWELLHDGKSYLIEDKNGIFVRRSVTHGKKHYPMAFDPPLRLLIIVPRPEDANTTFIDHRTSTLPLIRILSQIGPLISFTLLSPPTLVALRRKLCHALDEGQPYHIVHFDGHGVFDSRLGEGVLYFEHDEDCDRTTERRSKPATSRKIACELAPFRIPLVFLDACQTSTADSDPTGSVASALIDSGVSSVVAMSHSVLTETTRRFVEQFYGKIIDGKTVGQAVLSAQLYLKANPWRAKRLGGGINLEDWFVPVLFQAHDDPLLVRKERHCTVGQNQTGPLLLGYRSEVSHVFFGRSRELLKAERILERKRYVVIRGEGGEGKTALAVELAQWLVMIGRFARAVFVNLETARDADGLRSAICAQLLPDWLSQTAGHEPLVAELLARELGARRTMIVLDNMESVLPPPQGSEPATTFSRKSFEKILDLAIKLRDVGDTRLVLTSRERIMEQLTRNEIILGRLEREDAIIIVGELLSRGTLKPAIGDEGATEAQISELVETANCHARTLVALAREVAKRGVIQTTSRLRSLMTRLYKSYPEDRHRSLVASVELSLGRHTHKNSRSHQTTGGIYGRRQLSRD